jgi:hypothetical protein
MSFPKKGKSFPTDGDDKGYAVAVAAALREAVGETHQAVKTVARWTGANERTVKNWLASTSGPSGEHLVDLVRHSDEVLKALLMLAGKERAMTVKKLLDARDELFKVLDVLRSLLA